MVDNSEQLPAHEVRWGAFVAELDGTQEAVGWKTWLLGELGKYRLGPPHYGAEKRGEKILTMTSSQAELKPGEEDFCLRARGLRDAYERKAQEIAPSYGFGNTPRLLVGLSYGMINKILEEIEQKNNSR